MPFTLSACGEKGATALTRFVNTTGSFAMFNQTLNLDLITSPFSTMAVEAPSAFGMKLITVYLTQDIDPTTQSNTGGTAFIYLNPDCQDDISHCDISSGTAEDGSAMDKIVTTYFDFGAGTDAVNTALNAQARSIEAGTYKYVRMEFCKYNAGNAENITWTPSGGAAQTFKRNSCTVNSAEFSPALTIAAGESVTVNVSYDLTGLVETGLSSDSGDDCDASSGARNCFTMPTFIPSATK